MAASTTNSTRRNMRHMVKHPPIASSELAHNPPGGMVSILQACFADGGGPPFKCDPAYGRERDSPLSTLSFMSVDMEAKLTDGRLAYPAGPAR